MIFLDIFESITFKFSSTHILYSYGTGQRVLRKRLNDTWQFLEHIAKEKNVPEAISYFLSLSNFL